jgi:hypothetical protein
MEAVQAEWKGPTKIRDLSIFCSYVTMTNVDNDGTNLHPPIEKEISNFWKASMTSGEDS